MELRAHISLLTPNDRTAFAERVGTSVGHLRNVGYGYRACDPALALAIERDTADSPIGQVTRQDLRPDDYWLIWPDLPAPSHAEAKAA